MPQEQLELPQEPYALVPLSSSALELPKPKKRPKRMKFKRIGDKEINTFCDSGEQLQTNTGFEDFDAAQTFMSQFLNAILMPEEQPESAWNAAAGMLYDLKPADAVEGLVCSQMIVCQSLIMKLAKKSMNETPIERQEKYINCLNKSMRTFSALVETLGKYRNGGKQRITVEHVQINGGQAVIGDVHNTGGRVV